MTIRKELDVFFNQNQTDNDSIKLSLEDLEDQIKDLKEAIRNEKLWSLGADTPEVSMMHIDNMIHLEQELYQIENKLKNEQKISTIST